MIHESFIRIGPRGVVVSSGSPTAESPERLVAMGVVGFLVAGASLVTSLGRTHPTRTADTS